MAVAANRITMASNMMCDVSERARRAVSNVAATKAAASRLRRLSESCEAIRISRKRLSVNVVAGYGLAEGLDELVGRTSRT
jgi:hypothetical protein